MWQRYPAYLTTRMWWKDDNILSAFRPAKYTQIARQIAQDKAAFFVPADEAISRISPRLRKRSAHPRIIQYGEFALLGHSRSTDLTLIIGSCLMQEPAQDAATETR